MNIENQTVHELEMHKWCERGILHKCTRISQLEQCNAPISIRGLLILNMHGGWHMPDINENGMPKVKHFEKIQIN